MAVPLLLDEHVEHEVRDRLREYGYEVEHVHFHDTLQRGGGDDSLAAHSLENEMLIVTYDDDFETHYDESDYWGVLFFSDDDWTAADVATTVHRILELYDEDALNGMNLVGREWL